MSSYSTEIREANFPADLQNVQMLFSNYANYLASSPTGSANICITGFEKELAGLPAPYVAPGAVLLAFTDGRAAGCVALKQIHPDGFNGKAMEMKRLWVESGARGQKLGLKLVQAAIAHTKATGFDALFLDTVPEVMPEANRMYANLGFQQIPRYNRNDVPGVAFFRLDLKESIQLGSVSAS